MPTLRLNLVVNDDGSVTMEQFAKRAKRSFKSAEKDADDFSKSIDSAYGSVSKFAAGALAGFGLKEMGSSIFEAGMRAETLENAFKAATGSAERMQAELSFVRSEAKRLGQEFYSSAEAYKSIVAASKGTVMQGAGVREIYTAISEASTALGLSADQSSGALKAIEQMISKGKVTAEELRQQLGERLPGAFRLMAKAAGVSTAQLDKMLQSGEVGIDVLRKFANVVRAEFREGVEEASKSARAGVNRLITAWEDLKTSLAKGPAGQGMAGGMEWLTETLNEVNKVREQWNKNRLLIGQDTSPGAMKEADYRAVAEDMKSKKKDFDDLTGWLDSYKQKLREIRDARGNVFGLEWEKTAAADLNAQVTYRKSLEEFITKQKEIQATAMERELAASEQLEVTYSAFGGTWTQIEQDARGVMIAMGGVGATVQQNTDLLEQMNETIRQMETDNINRTISEMQTKRTETGGAVLKDKEFAADTQKLIEARGKAESEINTLLFQRAQLELQMQSGQMTGAEFSSAQAEIAKNEQIVQAIRARFEAIRAELGATEQLRQQIDANNEALLLQHMAAPMEQLKQYIELAKQGKLDVDTSGAIVSINQVMALIDSIPSRKTLIIDVQGAMSPAVPFTQAYNKLIGMLGSIPRGMDYTIRMMGAGGASLSGSLQAYSTMVQNAPFLQQYQEWQRIANAPISQLMSEDPWTDIDILKYKKSTAQHYMNLYANQYQLIMAQNAAAIAGAYDSGTTSGASGGSATPSVSYYGGPITINYNSKTGNARDDIITLADRMDKEVERRIRNNEWGPLQALLKALK